jgi:hypothetical protein
MFEKKTDNPLNSYGPIDLFLHVRNTLPATTGGKVGMIELELP